MSSSSTEPTLDDVEASDTAPDAERGDWERTLTDRIQQIVAQAKPGADESLPDLSTSQLGRIPDDALDDSSAGVDWTFVSTRDSAATTVVPSPEGTPDAVDAIDDATPIGFPVVLRRIDPEEAPAKKAPPEALQTQTVSARAEQTKPASTEASDATAPIPNAPHRGFGIVRRPKRGR